MSRGTDNYEEWRGLYEAMNKIKEVAPWEWMYEDDIFGVEYPETKEIGFVSVMGALGEHYAISVYRGWEGLFGFMSLRETSPEEVEMNPELLLDIPQLQASFENRSELTSKDLKVIKALGLKYRGKKAWPLFRSFRPDFVPWYLESEEIRFLQCALERLIEVAPKFKKNPRILRVGDGKVVVYVAKKKGDKLSWKKESRLIEPPKPELLDIFISMDVVDAVKKLPVSEDVFEVDVFMYPVPIQEKRGERPYFLYVFMMIDANSGAIAHIDLLRPEISFKHIWAKVPNKLIEGFSKLGMIPKRIMVNSNLLYDLFLPLSEELDFGLELQDDLPEHGKAINSLLDFLESRDK